MAPLPRPPSPLPPRCSRSSKLLRAFAPDHILASADHALNACGYRTHEFGDSVFVERIRAD